MWNVGTIYVNYILGKKESMTLSSAMSVYLGHKFTEWMVKIDHVMHFVSPGSRRDREGSSCPNRKTLRKSTEKNCSGIQTSPLFFFNLVLSRDKFPSHPFLQLSHNPCTHPTHSSPNHPLPLLHFCSPSPSSQREPEILVSAEICSWISWGDLRLHKVPVTQQRVSCEAGATDGSTP